MRFVLIASLLVWSSSAAAQDFIPAPLVPAPSKPRPKPAPKPADDEFMPTLIPAAPSKPAAKRPPPKPKTRKAEPMPAKLVIVGPKEPVKAEQRVNLNITVTDADGEPISAPLKITSDYGIVTPPIELDPGEYMCTYVAPAKLPSGGAAIIKAAVTTKMPKPPSAQLVLTFESDAGLELALLPVDQKPKQEPKKQLEAKDETELPGRPARIVFAEERVDIRPGQTVTVRFKVEDENGREVSGQDVKLRSPTGTFSDVRLEDGMYVAEYAPTDEQRGEVRLFAEAGGESLVGESLVVVEKPGLVPEERRFGIDVTGYAGGLTNFGKMATPSFELAADYQIISSIRIGVLGGLSPTSADVTSGKRGEPESANARKAEIGMNIIPLLARLTYLRPVGPVDIYAGAAAGAAFVNGTIKSATSTKEFSTIAPQFAGFAGVGLPLGPGVALVEVRMSHASVEFKDATTTVTGNVGGLSGALGYRLEL